MKIKVLIPNINEVIPYTFEEKKMDCGIFEPVIKNFLDTVPASKKPKIVHMLGIPGAGKTTFYQNNKQKFKNFLKIDFDAIMESLPQYQQDVQAIGNIKAFEKWQIPARIAGYELLRRAIEAKKNIFFDHGGTPMCHRELLANVKRLGYQTLMYYIECPIDVALKRAAEREKITKRHTPPQMIKDRNILIRKNLPVYQNLVDEFKKIS